MAATQDALYARLDADLSWSERELLDFPSRPQQGPYWCHKHKRECRPVERASHFLRRYTLDTLTRLKEFSKVRGPGDAVVIHGDAREADPARGSTPSSPRRPIRG